MSFILKDPSGNESWTVNGSLIQPTVPGASVDVSWIEVLNESPYLLNFSAGPYLVPIPAWYGYPFKIGDSGASLPISIQPVLIGSTANAPSSVCVITVYGANEEPAQKQPYPLVRQTNLGGVVTADYLINKTNAGATTVVVDISANDNPISFADNMSLYANGGVQWNTWGNSVATQNQVMRVQPGTLAGIKPTITLGDPTDSSISHFNGTLDQGGLGYGLSSPLSIQGQAVAGNPFYAVAPVVAGTNRVVVTSTAQQTILSYTPTANGFYRVTWAIDLHNGTANQTPKLAVNYTSPTGAIQDTAGGVYSGTIQPLNGFQTYAANAGAPTLFPACILVQANQPITVTYQSGGTPNDTISVVLEKLA